MPAGVPHRQPRINEDDITKIMKLHFQGVDVSAIKVRLGFSVSTIREIINVRRAEQGLPPTVQKKQYSGWTPPTTDLTKSRFSSKAKGASA